MNSKSNHESDLTSDIISFHPISFPLSDIPSDPRDSPLSHKPVIIVFSDSQEDHVQDGISGYQEPYDIVHKKYAWKSNFEQDYVMKDDLSSNLSNFSFPFTYFLDLFTSSITLVTFFNDTIFNGIESNYSQEWWNVDLKSKESKEEFTHHNLTHYFSFGTEEKRM